MIRLVSFFLFFVFSFTVSAEAVVFSSKKGVGGAATLSDLNQIGATWFYNWGPVMGYKSTSGIGNWDAAYWKKWVPLFYASASGGAVVNRMNDICANTDYCNGGYYLVGNEPDNPGGLEDGALGKNIDERVNASVERYGIIIKAIKAKDRQAKVILLGLTSKNTDFINKFVAEWKTHWSGDGELSNLADVVAGWHFHTYGNVWECPSDDGLAVRFINEINAAMQLNFGRIVPNQELWITEMGSLTVPTDEDRNKLKDRMKCLTNVYENSPVVTRYAWFYLGCNPNISAYTGCLKITWARYNLFYMNGDYSKSTINDLGQVYAGVPLKVSPTKVPPVITSTPTVMKTPTPTLRPSLTPKPNLTVTPTVKPSLAPTKRPTNTPVAPTSLPTIRLTPTVTLVPCSKKSMGDANCDGAVSIMDFGIWKTEFSGNVNQKTADFDGNGRVSIMDFGIWKIGFLERS